MSGKQQLSHMFDPYGKNFPPQRMVKIEEATEDELRQHYSDHNPYSLRGRNECAIEFDNQRDCFYMTYGAFDYDPLIADYKRYLLKQEMTHIAITCGDEF